MQLTWSTSCVARDEQFEYWRDVICDAFLPLEPVLPGAHALTFEGSVSATPLRQFHVASVTAHAHTVTRTKPGIARTRTGGFFANLIRNGTATARQAGNEAHAVAGDIVLLDTDEPFEFAMSGTCDVVCLTIPEAWIRSRFGKRGLPSSPVVNARTAAGRLASQYLRTLGNESESDLLDIELIAFDHLCHLLARERTPLGPAFDARTALRARILSHIDDRLCDRTLSAASASAAFGLSRSVLYEVLAEAGLTFAAEVRNRRLHAIDRDLRNPALLGRSIAEIAHAWGFEDPSSFARSYRAVFSESPSARRAAWTRRGEIR